MESRFVVARRIVFAFAVSIVLESLSAADEPLVVHEWGTFTCLQDDEGRELPGINIDDEPVPDFVHNLAPFILAQPVLSNKHWQYRMKGAPRHHPQVTMRLETPVIYFYPPENARDQPLKVDVDVQFRGGWLTEFYPEAKADAPGLRDRGFAFRDLTEETTGSLSWPNVQVGTSGAGSETSEHVWLAPRKVEAANVTAASGESERYLFYRGVGHLHAPLKAKRGASRNQIELFSNFGGVLGGEQTANIEYAWLVEVNEKGEARYRRVGPFAATKDGDKVLASVDLKSLEDSQGGLGDLRKEMHAALVAQGLFADEATAMLSTWERAYFTSPGQRLFFVVPRPWVDRYLPLSVAQEDETAPAKIERVMMARIELITDRQRELLANLAKAEIANPEWIDQLPPSEASERFLAGRADFGDLGVMIPPEYRMYLALGRFRNALVVAEENARPTASLNRFIEHYGLTPFRAPPTNDEERSGVAFGE
jgi:hypothetical protein